MTPDLLDDLLDRSAPATRAAADSDLTAMIADAASVRTPRARRRRIAIVSGALALVLAGGAGVAFASGLIDWAPRYESPDASFPVTLPSGRLCEVRIIAVAADDGERTEPQVDAQLREWLANTDLLRDLDLASARAEDARLAAESPDQTVVLDPAEGWLMDSPQAPDTRSADDVYASIVQIAVRDAVLAEANRLGLDLRTSTFNGGIKCEAAEQ